jgi:hypothetical protein
MAFGKPDPVPGTPEWDDALFERIAKGGAPTFEPPTLEGYRPDGPAAPPLDLSEFADEPRRNPLPQVDPAFDMKNLANRMMRFDYVNHRGEDKLRKVTFHGMAFGTAGEYYRLPTLVLVGWCHDQRAIRSFDVHKMRNIEVRWERMATTHDGPKSRAWDYREAGTRNGNSTAATAQ